MPASLHWRHFTAYSSLKNLTLLVRILRIFRGFQGPLQRARFPHNRPTPVERLLGKLRFFAELAPGEDGASFEAKGGAPLLRI